MSIHRSFVAGCGIGGGPEACSVSLFAFSGSSPPPEAACAFSSSAAFPSSDELSAGCASGGTSALPAPGPAPPAGPGLRLPPRGGLPLVRRALGGLRLRGHLRLRRLGSAVHRRRIHPL